MGGYIGTKAVLLSTTAASVSGDATIGGDLTVDTNTLYVDATNNRVGIGTSLPNQPLHVVGNTQSTGRFIAGSTLNAATPDYTFVSDTSLGMFRLPNVLGFSVAGSERMRIDSSGNLLVGTTDVTIGYSDGDVGFAVDGSNGYFGVARSPSASTQALAYLNRLNSDGDIVQFRKDGSTVGSIGTEDHTGFSTTYIEGVANSSGLFFGNQEILPSRNAALTDGTMDLGRSATRFQDIYATNGTIQTSDQNEKQQIASLTDAEITAAKAISKLFKTFKWNDSVAEKGDAARTHSGVIAQEVEQAMTDAGLNAGDYAFFISTTWWETQTEVPAVEAVDEVLDEDGNVITEAVEAQEAYTRTDTYHTAEEAPEGATERNRKGIRYPQLLSFIGAATEQRLASIESRLDALEGN